MTARDNFLLLHDLRAQIGEFFSRNSRPATVSTFPTASQLDDSQKGEWNMMNATRNTTKATIVLGALLSASILLAQAPGTSQAPDANAPQAAQTQPGNFHRNFDPSQMASHLGKRLGLSSDQVAQITPILAGRQQQMQSLRADSSLAPQDRRTKARAIMQDTNGKIEALLNDTQKQQYEQMLANRRSHRRDRQGEAPQA